MCFECNSRKKRGNCDCEKEFDRVHSELKYIAWKLYDLTCDFKDLQVDAKQLYQCGRYENYEKHLQSNFDRRKIEYGSSSKRYCSQKQQVANDESRKQHSSSKEYLTKHVAPQRKEESVAQKRKEEFSAQKRKEKYVCQKIREEQGNSDSENEVEVKSRCSTPQSSYCHKYKNGRDYEGLSTAELEQRLREKLSRLKINKKYKSEVSCSSRGEGKVEEECEVTSIRSQQRAEDNVSRKSREEYENRSVCSQQRMSGEECEKESLYSEEKSAVGIRCMRSKEKIAEARAHRVYLDGDKAYIVDHRNSKVIFVPKDIEY